MPSIDRSLASRASSQRTLASLQSRRVSSSGQIGCRPYSVSASRAGAARAAAILLLSCHATDTPDANNYLTFGYLHHTRSYGIGVLLNCNVLCCGWTVTMRLVQQNITSTTLTPGESTAQSTLEKHSELLSLPHSLRFCKLDLSITKGKKYNVKIFFISLLQNYILSISFIWKTYHIVLLKKMVARQLNTLTTVHRDNWAHSQMYAYELYIFHGFLFS